jgi:hypothetical protein
MISNNSGVVETATGEVGHRYGVRYHKIKNPGERMEVISDKQITSADGIIAVGLGFDGQFASRREGFAQVSIDSEFDFCVASRTVWLQKFAWSFPRRMFQSGPHTRSDRRTSAEEAGAPVITPASRERCRHIVCTRIG